MICDHGPIERLMNLENVGREGEAKDVALAPITNCEICKREKDP